MASEIGKNVPAPTAGWQSSKPSLGPNERNLDHVARLSAERAIRGRNAREGSGAIYNSMVLVGPEGSSRVIARSHLPGLEPDFLVAHRDSPLAVYETSVGRIGMAIWYDIRHSLQLAPGGAGGVALGDPGHPDACPRHRKPNRLVADRAGKERRSRVLRALVYADVDLALSRQQDFVYAQGGFETDGFADGPTDLYGPLVDPKLWPPMPRRAREPALIASR
jgi:hypothetical protein